MIALRNLNVFRIVESEEQAVELEQQGYERIPDYGKKEEAAEKAPASKKTAAKKE